MRPGVRAGTVDGQSRRGQDSGARGERLRRRRGNIPLACRIALTLVSEWQPMSRERFCKLQRGERLRDRRGREWSVTADAHQADGLGHVIIRSGDLVRRVPESWADDYQLLPAGEEGTPLSDRATIRSELGRMV